MSPQVRLSNFVNYIEDNIRRISNLYREIEEVQYQLNGLYTSLKADWQERVESASNELVANGSPEPLRETLERYQRGERQALETHISELKRKIAELRATSDQILKDAQAEISKLHGLNPVLNAREESLKARSLSETEGIAQLELKLESVGFWGRILGSRELKQKLREARRAHAKTLEDLNAVREEWVKKKEEVQKRQAELRGTWEKTSTEASQTQAELDYLAIHLDELSAKRGVQRYLAELTETPAIEGPLGKTLSEIASMNQKLQAYQQGLTSVAEALGVLTGIRTGMERFQQSATKVYEEQRRFNLKPLRLNIPKSTIQFQNTWADFRNKVKNEKYLGQHPLEFSKHVEHYTKDILTEEAIRRMFESMGEALNAATQAWS